MDKHFTSGDASAPEEPSTILNAEAAGKGTEKARIELLHKGVSESIIGAFYDVYNIFGYGFLESPYCGALVIELRRRGHRVGREIPVPVLYKGVQVATYRIDLLVDNAVIVEVKSTEHLNPNDQRQLLNYLRATPIEVGLLLHFGPKPKFYRLVASHSFRHK
jgi:GxxExxY protein